MIISGSRSRKTNALLNLIKGARWYWQNLFVCKRFWWTQVWIFDQKAQKRNNKTFLWSKCIYWIFKYDGWRSSEYYNPGDYNPSRKRKNLIVFDDMIADIMINKRFQAIIKELFIRCWKLNISLVFITSTNFCFKRCYIKFDTLFDYENQQQKRITKYCN